MADNTTLNLGVGGDVVRDKDRGGVKTQVVALDLNPAGSESLMSGVMPVSDNGGSLTVDGSITASNAAGDVASDSVDSGNPVKVGAKAVVVGSAPATVDAGDRVNLIANRAGVLFVQPGHPNVVTTRINITSTQTNAALITQATGGKIVVTEVHVAADNANTENVAIRIGFGATTTPSVAGTVYSHPGFPAGLEGGRGNGAGIIGIGADDEDLRITTGTIAASYSLDVLVSHYVLPS